MVYVLNSIAALAGVILMVGAYQRWRWLVDPPTDLWPYYSQAFLKRCFGTGAVVLITYAVGLAIVLASVAGTLIYYLNRR